MRVALILVLVLSGCAAPLFERQAAPAEAAPEALAPLPEGGIRPRARPSEGAVKTPAPAGALGTTVASLGNPAEPGLWLKTPLVSSERPGRVALGGASALVTLIPLDGPATAGSRMSLGAFQALGAALTDLPEVSVFAR